MDHWDHHKRAVLSKADKSFKQSIDEPIRNIVTLVNASSDFFTTSSCSGRIMLINETDREKRKNGSQFVYVSHDYVETKRASELLQSLKCLSGSVYFKLEPLIIHIECRSLQLAISLLNYMKSQDEFKHTSIVSASGKKFIVSIRAVVKMEIPIMYDNRIIVDDLLFEKYLEIANVRMRENFDAIRKLNGLIESGCLSGLADPECTEVEKPADLIWLKPQLREVMDVQLGERIRFDASSSFDYSVSPDGKCIICPKDGSKLGIIPDSGRRPMLNSGFLWTPLIHETFLIIDSADNLWVLITEERKSHNKKFAWKHVSGGRKIVGAFKQTDALLLESSESVFYEIEWLNDCRNKDRIKISKFEKYGAAIVVNEDSNSFSEEQWKLYSENMKVDLVLSRPNDEPLNQPRVLYSNHDLSTSAMYREDGVIYHIDFKADSFSSLFVFERKRMLEKVQAGERILEICHGVDCIGIHLLVKVPTVSLVFVPPNEAKASMIRASLIANGVGEDRFSFASDITTQIRADRIIVSTLTHPEIETMLTVSRCLNLLSRNPENNQHPIQKLKHGFFIIDYSV